MRRVRWLLVAGVLGWGAPVAAADDVDRLLAELSSGNGAAQSRAIERLRFLGPAKAGPPLRAMLASPDSEQRVRASAALAAVADPASGAELERALTDPDWEVRRNAADALRGLRRRASAAALAKALREDSNAKVRLACARALGPAGGGKALATAAVKDRELDVRLAALDELGRQLDASAASGVRPLLKDPVAIVRFAAARALAWGGVDAGRKYLTAALRSGEPDRERRAVTALSDCPRPWVAGLLASALSHQDVALPAAEALARRGDGRGLAWLARREAGGGAEARGAARVLDELGIRPERRAALAAGRP